MSQCPISTDRIDERVARIVGAIVAITVGLYLRFPHWAWLLILTLDFLARSVRRKWSPYARLACLPVALMGPSTPVDAAPKQFAAKIGLLMSAAALLLHASGLILWAKGVMTIMLLCALPEALFGYCVGCKFYSLYRRLVRGT